MRIGWLLIITALILVSGCAQRVIVSRGSRIPPENQELSSEQATEMFTRHTRGDKVSLAATYIDFTYVRAITRERSRSRAQEKRAYEQYVRRKTSFFVHLVLHGRENCRADRDDESDPLRLGNWSFQLNSSTGQSRQPEGLEPGPTQLAPSGGCLVQGYVHFPGNLWSDAEWIELEAAADEDERLVADVRWDIDVYRPPRRPRRPPQGNRRQRESPEEEEAEAEIPPESSNDSQSDETSDEETPDSSSSPGFGDPPLSQPE